MNESYITKIFTTLSFCLCNVRRWWKCEEIRIFDLSIFKSEFPDPKRSMFYQARDYLSVNKIEWRLHLAVLPPVLDVLMYLKLGEKRLLFMPQEMKQVYLNIVNISVGLFQFEDANI